MPHTIPFDTHAFVKKLTAAGLPERQAEVHAEAIADLVNDQLATKRDLEEHRIATKRDLEEHRIATKRDLAEVEARLQAQLRELEERIVGRLREQEVQTEGRLKELELRLKHDLTVRMGLMWVAGITILVALDKLL